MNHGSTVPRRRFLRNLTAGVMSSYAPLIAIPSASYVENAAESSGTAGLQLDQFIQRYMQVMNAPGLTLALADKSGVLRTAGFGYSSLELKTPVTTDLLFEIGSITKSFVALTLLQLHGEAKLDLQKPILDYLPWLPIECSYGVITTHHLLTHSSGLPGDLQLFPSDPQARHVQAFKPGEHFHYCNLGFSILGYLIQSLDGRPWPEAVRGRIMLPLDMTSSHAAITEATKAKRPQSYVPFYGDRSYPRQGRLWPASDLVFSNAAGSIVSTPGDMALYLQMLLNRGQGGRKRIVSEESFALFSTPYLKAAEFGPTASYGYGIGVDKLDGHTILRHTGGMISFASSIHVDLDGGVAAFASINAMQGYRPVPVTQFAIQTMNASARNQQPPAAPELPGQNIKNAEEYAGTYTATTGKHLVVVAEAGRLLIRSGSESISLENAGGDIFVTDAPDWPFSLVFGRAASETSADNKSAVVELCHGAEWYTNANYSGPRSFPEPPELQAYTGRFQAESAWSGSMHIVLRKGNLWIDGDTPLAPIGNGLFRVGEEPYSPETIEFLHIVEGKAQMLKVGGIDCWRVFAD